MRKPALLFALIVLCTVLCGHAVTAQDEDLEKQLQQLLQGGGKPTEKDLRAQAEQIVAAVSEVRHLRAKRPVAMSVQSKAEIRKYVEKRLEEATQDEELQGQEWALKRIGLLPADYPLKEKIVALYEEQIAGYYDPFEQKFFIADWIPMMLQTGIMAHELTHALQDQHYDLKPFLTPLPGNSDATTARQAVAEGDAVLTMMTYLYTVSGQGVDGIGNLSGQMRQSLELQASQYPVFATAPLYLRESLMFSYTAGADFALARQKKDGWAGVDQAFKVLPASTEQIIHPEKYPSDEPTPVALSAVKNDPPSGWRVVHEDVLGELGIQVLLVKEPDGVQAAAGWDGDRYIAFRTNKKETVVVHRSVWDSARDAEEFEGALKGYTSKLKGANCLIERKGESVVWIVGGSGGDRRKLAKSAWKG